MQDHIGRCIEAWQRNVAGLSQSLGSAMQAHAAQAQQEMQMVADNLTRLHLHLGGQQKSQPSALFASITSTARVLTGRRPQAACQLAMSAAAIKERLANVPVFTVVNDHEEFVLISNEDDGGTQDRYMGMFFFNEADAKSLLAKMRAEGGEAGSKARVASTNLASVYAYAMKPGAKPGPEGDDVIFRFVPATAEVDAALRLYDAAGVGAGGFLGVPLFQAEGLTVMADGKRCTPLFFSKSDLDVALGGAADAKHEGMEAALRTQARQTAEEIKALRKKVDGLKSDKVVQKAASQELKQLMSQDAQQQLALKQMNRNKMKLPKVDLGSLEEVLGRMEADLAGEWDDVFFVPAGTMTPTAK